MDVFELFEEHSLRVEKMIWVPASISDDACAPDLEALCEDWPDKDSLLFSHLPCLAKLDERSGEDYPEKDDVLETLVCKRVPGFIAQIARPVMQKVGKNSYQFSWGYVALEWIYGDTLEQVAERAVEWALDRR